MLLRDKWYHATNTITILTIILLIVHYFEPQTEISNGTITNNQLVDDKLMKTGQANTYRSHSQMICISKNYVAI